MSLQSSTPATPIISMLLLAKSLHGFASATLGASSLSLLSWTHVAPHRDLAVSLVCSLAPAAGSLLGTVLGAAGYSFIGPGAPALLAALLAACAIGYSGRVVAGGRLSFVDDQVSQSVSQTVSESVSQPVSQSVTQLLSQ